MTADHDPTVSILMQRGRRPVEGATDPDTCITATIETVDDDRAASLLGVLPIS